MAGSLQAEDLWQGDFAEAHLLDHNEVDCYCMENSRFGDDPNIAKAQSHQFSVTFYKFSLCQKILWYGKSFDLKDDPDRCRLGESSSVLDPG